MLLACMNEDTIIQEAAQTVVQTFAFPVFPEGYDMFRHGPVFSFAYVCMVSL